LKFHRLESSRLALQEAIQLRKKTNHTIWDAICPYDCAEQIGLEIRFVDISSLEGVYLKSSPPLILISSLRPSVRATFTCAHEIGHHVFGHGTCVDQDNGSHDNFSIEREEFLAQTFAGFFLMPKVAVERAFAVRKWKIETCSPNDIYLISCWFGIGFETLISHMEYGIKVLSTTHARVLRKASVKEIKTNLIGMELDGNLIVVDKHWTSRAIDIQVGDIVILSKGVVLNGDNLKPLNIFSKSYELFQGNKPGVGQFYDPNNGWSTFVRVSRKEFIGRSIFRHLEDPEYE
jgi:Zn-dependent peptidase ImmA (M78 family)